MQPDMSTYLSCSSYNTKLVFYLMSQDWQQLLTKDSESLLTHITPDLFVILRLLCENS